MRLKAKIKQLMGRAEDIKGVQKKEEEVTAMEGLEETQEAMARVTLSPGRNAYYSGGSCITIDKDPRADLLNYLVMSQIFLFRPVQRHKPYSRLHNPIAHCPIVNKWLF